MLSNTKQTFVMREVVLLNITFNDWSSEKFKSYIYACTEV
jgi:hypothetical protein